ncbi:DUF6115 domain-containing protein [Paenibacillus solisilvae]|uniref:DUF6115 domain-containing protein n=1 Tax=Paenibacillus solisilvae TaxID=2486751 RepID=A0ABW0VT33_9BACL
MEAWQTIMLLGAVAIVCATVLPRKAAPMKNDSINQPSQTVRNMETALDSFMENMESDNRQMVELVTKFQQDAQANAVKSEQRIKELEKRCADLEAVLSEQAQYASAASIEPALGKPLSVEAQKRPSAQNTIETTAVDSEESSPAAEKSSIRSRYYELFELYNHGKSIEAIAKKLGINKGEVQLILQLSKQEEAGRDE